VLGDVRAAVEDWPELQARLNADADRLGDEEAASLLHWFADGAMTLLGYHVEQPGQHPGQSLGVLRRPGEPIWDDASCTAAIAYFKRGGPAPLLAKSSCEATLRIVSARRARQYSR